MACRPFRHPWVVLALVLAACGGGGSRSVTSSPAAPTSVSSTVPASAVPRDVIFTAGRALEPSLDRPGASITVIPDGAPKQGLANVVVESDAAVTSGAGAVGLACRQSDRGAYVFTLDPSARTWLIGRLQGGGPPKPLAGATSSTIRTGAGPLHLRAQCRALSQPGNPAALSVSVGGTPLGEVVDADSPLVEGAAGLALTSGASMLRARFDGFTIRQLPG